MCAGVTADVRDGLSFVCTTAYSGDESVRQIDKFEPRLIYKLFDSFWNQLKSKLKNFKMTFINVGFIFHLCLIPTYVYAILTNKKQRGASSINTSFFI